jgi:hypothetical protein
MQRHASKVHLRRGRRLGHELLHFLGLRSTRADAEERRSWKVCVVEVEDEEEDGCMEETRMSVVGQTVG